MKKILFAIACLLIAAPVWALPVTFTESYLGSASDGNFFEVGNGGRAEFNFDLTQEGGKANLYNIFGTRVGQKNPTLDETSFGSAVYGYDIQSAILSFAISSADLQSEKVQINSGISDGNKNIFEKTYSLGNWSWREGLQRQQSYLVIDLLNITGLEDVLSDGKFMAISLSPINFFGNDFRIDQAELFVIANSGAAPVPEPSSMLLFGAGGLMLFTIKKKREQHKKSFLAR